VSHAASHLLARLHAPPARFCADAAVLVLTRVPLAFVAAQATSCRAGEEHPTNELVIRAGASRGDASRDVADVGAVEIEANALGQILDHVLGKASVAARGARLGTGITLLDATDQSVVGTPARVWVRTDHLLNLHVFLSELTRRPVRVTRTLQQAFVRQADVWGLYRFPPRRAHTSRVRALGARRILVWERGRPTPR
jgi:hypothetical protein